MKRTGKMRLLSLEISLGPSSFFLRKECMTHLITQEPLQLPEKIHRLMSLLGKPSIAQEELLWAHHSHRAHSSLHSPQSPPACMCPPPSTWSPGMANALWHPCWLLAVDNTATLAPSSPWCPHRAPCLQVPCEAMAHLPFFYWASLGLIKPLLLKQPVYFCVPNCTQTNPGLSSRSRIEDWEEYWVWPSIQ